MKHCCWLWLLVAGCNFAPTYARPAAPVAQHFRGEQGDTLSEEVPGIAWREVVTDSRLAKLIELALQQNRDLRATSANLQAVRAQYDAQRSEQLPTLVAQGSAVFGRTGSTVSTARSYALNLGISSWELDFFGRLRNLSESALQTYLASEAGVRATRLALVADVANAYLDLAASGELLAVSQEMLVSAQRSAEITRELKQAGLSNGVEVWDAQTVVAQAQSDIASYTTQVAQAVNALELLVGVPLGDDVLPPSLQALDQRVRPVPTDVSTRVLLLRPDVEQAEHLLIASHADIGAARAAYFPQVTLSAVVGLAASTLSGLGSLNSATATATPAFSVPLLGGSRDGDLAAAKAGREAYLATYEYTIQTAFKEVSDALARAATLKQQRQAQQDLVQASQASYALSQAQYRAGTTAHLNVLVAQRTWYAAQQTAVATELEAIVNRIELYRVIGNDPSLVEP